MSIIETQDESEADASTYSGNYFRSTDFNDFKPFLKYLAVYKIIIFLNRVACSSGSNGCFGFPSNCVELQNCDMLVKYTFDAKDKKYNFELIKR